MKKSFDLTLLEIHARDFNVQSVYVWFSDFDRFSRLNFSIFKSNFFSFSNFSIFCLQHISCKMHNKFTFFSQHREYGQFPIAYDWRQNLLQTFSLYNAYRSCRIQIFSQWTVAILYFEKFLGRLRFQNSFVHNHKYS